MYGARWKLKAKVIAKPKLACDRIDRDSKTSQILCLELKLYIPDLMAYTRIDKAF